MSTTTDAETETETEPIEQLREIFSHDTVYEVETAKKNLVVHVTCDQSILAGCELRQALRAGFIPDGVSTKEDRVYFDHRPDAAIAIPTDE